MKAPEAQKISPPEPEVWPLSVEAYHVLGEAGLVPRNSELLYGAVYLKMSKSPMHSALVGRLLKLLAQNSLPGFVVRCEQPLACKDSEPEPDLAVVKGSDEDFWRQHPTTAELVIEVCVTSYDYDHSKLRAYANAGIKEVWFVLATEKEIEVHRFPNDGQFREKKVHGPGGSLSSAAVPNFTVDLTAFFTQ